jgi:hypothetical protein
MSRFATLVIVAQTKGAVKYGEVDSNGQPINDNRSGTVGQIYVRKDCLSRPYPQQWLVPLPGESWEPKE